MRYVIEPLDHWHLKALSVTEAAEGGNRVSTLPDEVVARLMQHNSWSLLSTEGDVIACGGTIEEWPGRHGGWLYFTLETRRHMIRLTRLVQSFLEPVRGRIEATVRRDFVAGHRFIQLVGFEVENPPGVLQAYGPDGEDHISYVKFQ